jgi:hypothetical protein
MPRVGAGDHRPGSASTLAPVFCSKLPEPRGFSCAAATGLEHSVKSAWRRLAPGALNDAPHELPVLVGELPE